MSLKWCFGAETSDPPVGAELDHQMTTVPWFTSYGLRRRLVYLLRSARALAVRGPCTGLSNPQRMALTEYQGFALLLDRKVPLDDRIFAGKGYETKQSDRLFSMIKAVHDIRGKRYFLDVGAHWGLYSLLAHQSGWFDHIIAFEPDPLNRAQLHAQLFLNDLANQIEVRGVALSDSTGSADFLRSQAHSLGNRGGVGLKERTRNDDPSTVVVPIDKLDNQLRIRGDVVFMKVDVEGHERHVLAGAEALLAHNQVVLQVECFEPDRTLNLGILERLGYRKLDEIGPDLFFTNFPLR